MLNVAQIGVGYWGPNLLRNLIDNPRCNLKTVVELSEDRQLYIKNHYKNIIVTSQIQQVIDDNDIDAVIISTPVKTHFDLAYKLLNAGKHVLVEKPIATNLSEVDKLKKISTEKNLLVMAGHTFLYNSAVIKVKEIIDNGDLGDIRYIYSQRVNLGRIRDDVDAMWNLAPHDLSIIQYWLDDMEPIEINVNGSSYIQNGINDVTFINLKFKNKIMANIHVSWLDPRKIRRMTIVGSKKMIVYDDISDEKIKLYNKGIDKVSTLGKNMDFDEKSFTYHNRNQELYVPNIDWEEPLKVEIDHFFDCIIDNISCISGIDHARTVVKILCDASNDN